MMMDRVTAVTIKAPMIITVVRSIQPSSSLSLR